MIGTNKEQANYPTKLKDQDTKPRRIEEWQVGWLMGVVNPTRSLDDVSNDVSCRWRLMIGTRFQVESQLAYGIVPRVHGDEKCIDVRRMYEVSRSNRCSSLGEFHWWKQRDMTSSLARNASSVLTI
ncbi:hypothetical protein Tco_1499792 [Tanacetum coccineum]